MAISYNIYANNRQGGPVNYQTPVATTSGHSIVVGALSVNSDNRFAVRAFDTVSGIEEANTDARIRIVIDASGQNVSARPNPVVGLSAWPRASGTCWVSWGYDGSGQGGPPSSFLVTLIPSDASQVSGPALTVAYLPSVSGYGCTLAGLLANASYTIEVQAVGASASLVSAVASVAIEYRASPLSTVDSLAAVPTA